MGKGDGMRQIYSVGNDLLSEKPDGPAPVPLKLAEVGNRTARAGTAILAAWAQALRFCTVFLRPETMQIRHRNTAHHGTDDAHVTLIGSAQKQII